MSNLHFNLNVADRYVNNSQRIRILSEDWVLNNLFCPKCGNEKLSNYSNNKPVADFYCNHCKADFELKSKLGLMGKKIIDGAYNKMIERITSSQNPNFLFLNYTKTFSIDNLFVIPNLFFTPQLIEKRKALSSNARRSGWVGCNILFNNLPQNAKIYIVRNGFFQQKKIIVESWSKISFLKNIKIENRGWLFEIMKCIDELKKNEFTLNNLYTFENYLSNKFPKNNNVKPKIRQQLQVLRDFRYLQFLGNGVYKLSNHE